MDVVHKEIYAFAANVVVLVEHQLSLLMAKVRIMDTYNNLLGTEHMD